MKNKKRYSRRLLQACCTVTFLFILFFVVFLTNSSLQQSKSVEEIYDLKEDILALDWRSTPTEELRLYLTQTSEMYVGVLWSSIFVTLVAKKYH